MQDDSEIGSSDDSHIALKLEKLASDVRLTPEILSKLKKLAYSFIHQKKGLSKI